MDKLNVTNLSFAYKISQRSFWKKSQIQKKEIVTNFNINLKHKEVYGLIGGSGSGKSTILRLIAGLERPDAGTILMDNQVISSQNIFVAAHKRNIGLVFQDYGLFPHLTVEKNIAYGLYKFDSDEKKHVIEEMLMLINMKNHRKLYPYQLSEGQSQRVALARSLAPKPQLLLLDEPFSNLDTQIKIKIRREIKEILTSMGISCILSTHDMEDIKHICHNVKKIGDT